jgi:hypothetical protein
MVNVNFDFPQTIRFWIEAETRISYPLQLSDLMDESANESDLCIEIVDDITNQRERKYIKRSKLDKIGVIRLRLKNG